MEDFTQFFELQQGMFNMYSAVSFDFDEITLPYKQTGPSNAGRVTVAETTLPRAFRAHRIRNLIRH
jgi:hypothetical protein